MFNLGDPSNTGEFTPFLSYQLDHLNMLHYAPNDVILGDWLKSFYVSNHVAEFITPILWLLFVTNHVSSQLSVFFINCVGQDNYIYVSVR